MKSAHASMPPTTYIYGHAGATAFLSYGTIARSSMRENQLHGDGQRTLQRVAVAELSFTTCPLARATRIGALAGVVNHGQMWQGVTCQSFGWPMLPAGANRQGKRRRRILSRGNQENRFG